RSHRDEGPFRFRPLASRVHGGIVDRLVQLRAALIVLGAFVVCATACRRERPETSPSASASASPEPVPIATYVGSDKCGGCHAKPYAAWQTSHHRLAMQAPSETSMLGDFADGDVRYFGETTHFRRRESSYEVETEDVSRGAGSKTHGKRSYDVKYAFGV